jgi:hypothetical protein
VGHGDSLSPAIYSVFVLEKGLQAALESLCSAGDGNVNQGSSDLKNFCSHITSLGCKAAERGAN